MRYTLTNYEVYLEVDSMGATLTSLRDVHGVEYLWQGDPAYWKGQAPLLFPVVGGVRDKKCRIGGQEYPMPRHGVARIHEFRKEEAGADTLSFLLTADTETKSMYPFDFTLQVDFILTGRTLTQRFTVTNRDEKEMPFCLGCHPGFNVPLLPGEQFTDYVVKFAKTETCDSPIIDGATDLILTGQRQPVLDHTDTLPLTHALFYRDALVLEQLQSRQVSLYSTETLRGVEMDFHGFEYFGIWQAKDAPFVCLEPWTGTATTDLEGDDLAEKRGMALLAPGDSKELSMKLTLL